MPEKPSAFVPSHPAERLERLLQNPELDPSLRQALESRVQKLNGAFPRPSRHQDQNWVREQASKMESDFPALFEK